MTLPPWRGRSALPLCPVVRLAWGRPPGLDGRGFGACVKGARSFLPRVAARWAAPTLDPRPCAAGNALGRAAGGRVSPLGCLWRAAVGACGFVGPAGRAAVVWGGSATAGEGGGEVHAPPVTVVLAGRHPLRSSAGEGPPVQVVRGRGRFPGCGPVGGARRWCGVAGHRLGGYLKSSGRGSCPAGHRPVGEEGLVGEDRGGLGKLSSVTDTDAAQIRRQSVRNL